MSAAKSEFNYLRNIGNGRPGCRRGAVTNRYQIYARPIYEQIKDGLRRLILSDVIRQDEKLPSVRELASQLAINPNTIQKAYRELEQEGYVYTVSGRGSFAAPLSDVRTGRQETLLAQFDEAVTELLYLKKDPNELKQRIDQLQQGGASE